MKKALLAVALVFLVAQAAAGQVEVRHYRLHGHFADAYFGTWGEGGCALTDVAANIAESVRVVETGPPPEPEITARVRFLRADMCTGEVWTDVSAEGVPQVLEFGKDTVHVQATFTGQDAVTGADAQVVVDLTWAKDPQGHVESGRYISRMIDPGWRETLRTYAMSYAALLTGSVVAGEYEEIADSDGYAYFGMTREGDATIIKLR